MPLCIPAEKRRNFELQAGMGNEMLVANPLLPRPLPPRVHRPGGPGTQGSPLQTMLAVGEGAEGRRRRQIWHVRSRAIMHRRGSRASRNGWNHFRIWHWISRPACRTCRCRRWHTRPGPAPGPASPGRIWRWRRASPC